MTLSQSNDVLIVSRPFDPMVPGMVVGVTITIVFAVRFVVFVIVRHKVIQIKPVVSGDKVDRRPRLASTLVEQIARSRNAFRHFGKHSGVALPVATYCVAKLIVPFCPARRELADLIASWSDIPWFGYQFDARKNRVLATGVKKASTFVEAIGLTRKNCRKVEREAIDPHSVAQYRNESATICNTRW